VIAPPIMRAMIWTASPTDLSSVVRVVENPLTHVSSCNRLFGPGLTISRMMTVEKEFTTPFGMALQTQSVSD
jgi:hypothetical protein